MADLTELRIATQATLNADEKVLGAFVGMRGPRPGVEASAVLVFTGCLLVTNGCWVSVPVSVAFFVGVNLARSFVTVARTEANVVVLENRRRSLPRPSAIPMRLPVDSITFRGDVGDPKVRVGPEELWVKGAQQDEARRLSRLTRQVD